jgi:hypothetical protein
MYYSGANRIDAANLPGASSPPGSSATATDVSATSHGHNNSNSSSSGSGSGINSSSKYKLKSPQRPSSRNGGLMNTSSGFSSSAAPTAQQQQQQHQQQQHQHKARALSFSAAVGAAVGATVGGSRLSTGNGSSSNGGAGGIDTLLRGIDTLYGTKRGHIHASQHTVIPALPPPAGVNFDAVPFNRYVEQQQKNSKVVAQQ